jgi:hypothetical protein
VKLNEILDRIEHLCQKAELSFADKCASIATAVGNFNEKSLLSHLDEAGIIPERFGHDSSEEKLFAKYCDALVTRSLSALGMSAELIFERADAADVVASYGKYKLVSDAKAFRLSRTAKNQKDFKVEALNQWRKGADYACLVSPLYQYPSASSQIYQQARTYNVTLLSYTHLAFLIRNHTKPAALKPLWEVAQTTPAGKSARSYWAMVGKVVSQISGTKAVDWDNAVEAASALLPRQAQEQIEFWEHQKARILKLDKQSAQEELVDALKINSKIDVIRRSVADLQETKGTFET